MCFLLSLRREEPPQTFPQRTTLRFLASSLYANVAQVESCKKQNKKKSQRTCVLHAAVHAAQRRFVLCCWYMTLHILMRACVCERPACAAREESERESVCVHVCEADVLCSVLFPRLAGLCCCSLVQTGLATCFSVCQDKPRPRRFNLSIAAAKSCPQQLP